MFYYVSQLTAWWSPLRVFQYTTFRAVGAAISALVICIVTGPWVNRKLTELKSGQPIRGADDLGELAQKHNEKKGTPTMGGILILWAVADATILWARPDNPLVLLCLATVLCMGSVGFLDDYSKITERNSKGITARAKLMTQLLFGLAIGIYLVSEPTLAKVARQFCVPFLKAPLVMDMGIFAVIWAAIVVTSSSNAVNLTDGMDGLAIGCTLIVALAFVVLTF